MKKQCEYITIAGQCESVPLPNSPFCEKHSRRDQDEIKLGQYLVSKKLFGEAPLRHMEADEIKSLKTEISLLRSMIERRWNMLENEVEFVAAFPTMKDSLDRKSTRLNSSHYS